jgi:hypothetical protein
MSRTTDSADAVTAAVSRQYLEYLIGKSLQIPSTSSVAAMRPQLEQAQL